MPHPCHKKSQSASHRLHGRAFFLQKAAKKDLIRHMKELQGKCLNTPIYVHDDRKIVYCDDLKFPCGWKPGDGYFLVRLHEGFICVGWVDGTHNLTIEFRGTNPEPLIREVTRQDFVDKPHAAYIAAEIILAHNCLVSGDEYIQR